MYWSWARPYGAHKSLSVSPISWLQEIGFIQPPLSSWVPIGRLKQLPIREGRECRDKGGTYKKQSGGLEAGPCSSSSGKFSSGRRVPLFATPELQHTRPPCPSPTPGVYPNSCPLSRWGHIHDNIFKPFAGTETPTEWEKSRIRCP